MKAQFECSHDNVNWAVPFNAGNIFTGIDSTDGYVYAGFAPPVCRFIRIKYTETGGSASATFDSELTLS